MVESNMGRRVRLDSLRFEATIRSVASKHRTAQGDASRLERITRGSRAASERRERGEPSGPPGHRVRHRSSVIWMWTCPLTSGPFSRWWHRSSQVTVTCQSAAASPPALTSCAVPAVKLSRIYNLLLRSALRPRFTVDLRVQAPRRETAELLLPCTTKTGSSTRSSSFWPNETASASMRCQSTGSMTPTHGSTWSAWPRKNCGAWPARSHQSHGQGRVAAPGGQGITFIPETTRYA